MNLLITGCCGHIGSYLVNNIYKIDKINKTFIVDNLHSTQINSLFNIHKRNNDISPIFYLHFEEPFNGKVNIDLLFNCDVHSTIPSNYYIEIFFNDDTSDSKTFKKQKDLIQYIKEIMKGNI